VAARTGHFSAGNENCLSLWRSGKTRTVHHPGHDAAPQRYAPHTHNLDEMLTIISGNLDHYTGPKMNPSEGLHMEAGGFVHLPVNMGHALKAGDSGAILQVSGVGPFGMTYVDPKDDPRHR
jgi:hypothetical protein